MKELTKAEYLKLCIKKGFLKDIKWYAAMFTLPVDKYTKTKYHKFDRNTVIVTIDDVEYILTDANCQDPIYSHTDKITLTSADLDNVRDSVETTIGLVIINYVLLVVPFGATVEYKTSLNIKNIENSIISPLLVSDKDYVPGKIKVSNYTKEFVNGGKFLESLSGFFVVSATEKSLLPPPGIVEYRETLIKEFVEKYGDNVFEDYVRIAEFDELLKAYDDAYLKGDPANGIVISGKIINSRKKMQLSTGAEAGFETGDKAVQIITSIREGIPSDPKQLTAAINISRAGSYSRGSETKDGGLLAKVMLRAVSAIRINKGDCGVKKGTDFFVSESMHKKIIGRYVIENNKSIEILDDAHAKQYIGKNVNMRSFMYCKETGNNFCATCAGKSLAARETGISLLITEVSSIFLAASMAKMHAGSIEAVDIEFDDLFY